MKTRTLLVFSLASILFAACGTVDENEGSQDYPLFTQILNTGSCTLQGIYFQPRYEVTTQDPADWGDNYLPVSQLGQNEYVIITNLARLEYDALAVWDRSGTQVTMISDVHAAWLSTAPRIVVYAGCTEDSRSLGYQWGDHDTEGKTDMTP